MLLLGLMLSLQQCFQSIKPLTTELAVKIVNAQGQALEGAKVYLFRSELFFATGTNIFAEGTTNREGIVVFEDLDAENYFVYAIHEQGGRVFDNGRKSYFIANPLIGNSITYLNIPLEDARPMRPSKIVLEKILIVYGSEFKNNFFENQYDIIVRDGNGVLLGGSGSPISFFPEAISSFEILLVEEGTFDTPLVVDLGSEEQLFLKIDALGTQNATAREVFFEDIFPYTRELNTVSESEPVGFRRLAYPRRIRYNFSGDGFADVFIRWE